MARPSPYSPEQRSAIIQAAIGAKAGGTWNDGLKAAQDAGYKGGLAYLMKLIRGSDIGSKRRPGRPKKSSGVAVPMKRRPGRPTKVNGKTGLGEIDHVVERMVAQRTREVLRQALDTLNAATAAIKRAL